MQLLPQSRRGTWLLAGAVWCAACAGLWWALPVVPLVVLHANEAYELLAFGGPFGLTLAQRSLPMVQNDRSIPQALDLLDVHTGDAVCNLIPRMRGLEILGASGDSREWLVLISADKDDQLLMIDLQSRSSRLLALTVASGYSWTYQLSPDGKLVTAKGKESDLVLWDSITNSLKAQLPGVGPPYSFSADGKTLVGIGEAGVAVIDLVSLTKRTDLPIPEHFHPASIEPLAVTEDARYVAGLFYYSEQPLSTTTKYVLCWEVNQ
jgi:hypothetical protein